MKKIVFASFFLFLSFFSLHAAEYFSKAMPIWQYTIKADVSAKVIFSDELKEGKKGDNKIVIKLDDKIDKIDLNTTKLQYNYLKESIKNTEKIYQIDKRSYERIKNLPTYSKTQKDQKLTKMLNSKNLLLNQKTNLANLYLKIKSLEDKISKKNIKISPKYYITKIYVKKGDFVNPSMPLLDIADLSKAKLTIFVTDEDLKKIKNQNILINGKKQKYKIVKILKVADSINLSGYKVEILIDPPEIFSKLIKVEIK